MPKRRTRTTGAVLSNNPHGTPEYLARLDLSKCRDELFRDCRSEIWELFHNLPHECNDVDSTGVVRVAQELHEDIDDVGSNFGELDSAGVDALDEELTVFEVLTVSLWLHLGS